jgi:hypothetical protein
MNPGENNSVSIIIFISIPIYREQSSIFGCLLLCYFAVYQHIKPKHIFLLCLPLSLILNSF